MGKLRIFLIELDNNKEVYFPGDEVTGQVVFELYSTLKIKEILLTFTGEAVNGWQEIKSGYENQKFNFQRNKEKYFEEKLSLFQGDTEKEKKEGTEFTAKSHSFPFKFVLPNDIPSSFEANEGSSGHVRYTLNVSLDKTWDSGYNCRRAITVICSLDLNKYDDVTVTTYFSTVKSKCTIYHPVIGKDKSIQPGDNDSWTEEIHIPALPPSNLDGCKIIDIYYRLELKIEPDGISFPFSAFQKITIGTVPLRSVVQRTLATIKAETLTSPDPPQMQFKESTFGEVRIKQSNDNDNTHGELLYTALYPWFDWLK